MPTIVVTLAGDLRIRAHQYVRRTSVGGVAGVSPTEGGEIGVVEREPAGNGNSVRWQIKLRVASNEENRRPPAEPFTGAAPGRPRSAALASRRDQVGKRVAIQFLEERRQRALHGCLQDAVPRLDRTDTLLAKAGDQHQVRLAPLHHVADTNCFRRSA